MLKIEYIRKLKKMNKLVLFRNIEQEYKKAGISIKVPKAVTEEIDKKTRDIFALTNRGIVATFTNLPEFLRDIKIEKSWIY